jgi:hypothetical protein
VKLAIVESPYKGDIKRNEKYARRAMAFLLRYNYAPLASHLLYTQEDVLNDEVEKERQQGINAGFAWGKRADIICFFMDYGMSSGMIKALEYYSYECSQLPLANRLLIKFLYIGTNNKPKKDNPKKGE